MANEIFGAHEYDEGNSPEERAEEMWSDEQDEAMWKIEGVCDLEDPALLCDDDEDDGDDEEEKEDPYRIRAREEMEWERDNGHSGYDDAQMELLAAYDAGMSRGDVYEEMNARLEEEMLAQEEALWEDDDEDGGWMPDDDLDDEDWLDEEDDWVDFDDPF